MDYARFLGLRSAVWDAFETRLASARAEPSRISHGALEELALHYRQVLHDHALAASRFPGTGAARRLARLALEGTHWLQWDRGDRLPGIGAFFREAFPAAFRRALPRLGLATGLFLVAALLGFTLGVVQPSVGLAFLGPGVVAELREGRLWTESIVTAVPPSISSSAIATNNMTVAITGWGGGALGGIGTFYVTLVNGFLLGSIFALTLHYSLVGQLAEFVVAHGLLEITLILVCAAAGLGLGRALVAAEDRPRAQVVAEASRESLILLVGCLPWFLLLGLVEGFVSPSALPAIVKALLGASLESAFLALALGATRTAA